MSTPLRPGTRLRQHAARSRSLAGVTRKWVYADSVGGNDANDGLTPATAKQTLAGAQAILAAGWGLRLVRGSYWREQLNVPANNVAIGVYGSGAMPVIDGADVVTSGWTQPDSVTYPNVWSQSWTRASATTTGSEYLGYWEAGARTTFRTSLANLQAGSNGDWHTTSLTTQTSTVSIRSAADPNSDGILREITKRHYGISGHTTTLGVTRTGQAFVGPIEIKRCVGHYNALPAGPGTHKRFLLRDGNIHHSVTQGALTEDCLGTEYHPGIAPSVFVAYQADGTSFDHTFRRCLALLPGGASRSQLTSASAFYAHSSNGAFANMRALSLEGCVAKGVTHCSSAAITFAALGGYCEDPWETFYQASATENTLRHLMSRETADQGSTPSNKAGIRRLYGAAARPTIDAQHCAIHTWRGNPLLVGGPDAAVIDRCGFVSQNSSAPAQGVSGDAPTNLAITRSVFWGGRSYGGFVTGYSGDYNVFYFVGSAAPQFQFNGSTYGTLATFQAASGTDANSVFLKNTDQVSGNGIAFWLGVSSGANAGPADGDWRINPSAKVYKADGSSLTGLFADGLTPITAAGPQEHWDFNLKAVASGPPTTYPVPPATVAEMRTYLEDPNGWYWYP